MGELTGLRALVTGGSSGIGACVARELAARGADLVLTARRKDALTEVAASCTGVKVDVIACDLGKPEGAGQVWAAATAGGPVDIVINNAGFGTLQPFAQTEWSRDAEMIELNMSALVELSKRFVAGRTQRGYLVNISSIGAYQSVPNMALYAASKAFVRNFTEALHDELAGSEVSATCICPGGTKTAFHDVAGASGYSWLARVSMLSAEQVAAITVRAMLKRKRTVVTGVLNKIACWSVRLVPRRFAAWSSSRLMPKPKLALPPRTDATQSS
jgi:short-subunit dehydrogenase